MTIKASGCSALIVAAGMLVCLTGPSWAAVGADATATNARHNLHHPKKYAHRKSGKVALKSATARDAADDGDTLSAISPSVANANARLASADTPDGNAKAMTARANDILQAAPDRPDAQMAADRQAAPSNQAAAGYKVVAADQLNDVDRALHDGAPAAPMTLASAEAPVMAAAPILAGSNEHSTWDETSLIGKIFIGFGALLTMASAARMFMA